MPQAKGETVVIFAIGTGVLFLKSQYEDLMLEMIKESSSMIIYSSIEISPLTLEFFTS